MLQPPQPGSQDVNPARLTIRTWRVEIRDGHVFTAVARRSDRRTPRPGHLLPVQSRPGRRTLLGIDEQIAKAENAVAGKVPVKRNRFIVITGADKSVNRVLEAKPATWPGSRVTPPTSPTRHRSS